jgi:hypothetical protein
MQTIVNHKHFSQSAAQMGYIPSSWSTIECNDRKPEIMPGSGEYSVS